MKVLKLVLVVGLLLFWSYGSSAEGYTTNTFDPKKYAI